MMHKIGDLMYCNRYGLMQITDINDSAWQRTYAIYAFSDGCTYRLSGTDVTIYKQNWIPDE